MLQEKAMANTQRNVFDSLGGRLFCHSVSFCCNITYNYFLSFCCFLLFLNVRLTYIKTTSYQNRITPFRFDVDVTCLLSFFLG